MRCILFLLLCGVCCGCSRRYADEEAAVTGEVAKRIALFSTAAPPAPKPDKVPRDSCTVCSGTGRVRSGDGLAWVPCGNCVTPVAVVAAPVAAPVIDREPAGLLRRVRGRGRFRRLRIFRRCR